MCKCNASWTSCRSSSGSCFNNCLTHQYRSVTEFLSWIFIIQNQFLSFFLQYIVFWSVYYMAATWTIALMVVVAMTSFSTELHLSWQCYHHLFCFCWNIVKGNDWIKFFINMDLTNNINMDSLFIWILKHNCYCFIN